MSLPPQAMIYYFSGAGSTWYVAQTYAQMLSMQGVECQIAPIDLVLPDDSPPPPDALVGIGMPVHGRGLPEPARAWINRLPAGDDRPTFIFATCRGHQGKGLSELSQHAGQRGYNVLHESLYLSDGMPWSASGKAAIWLRTDIVEAVTQMDQGLQRIVPESEALQAPLLLMRTLYRAARRFASRLLPVNGDCNLCMACLRLCPVRAISLQRPVDAREDQQLSITIGRDCILCLRCAAICPQHAITSARPGLFPIPVVEPGFVGTLEAAHQDEG